MVAVAPDVFKALADPSRRQVLDLLRQRDGRTLGELTAGLPMARQSATQHLDVLEAAGLVTVVWRGRQKLHYLNPVPLYELQQRWIGRFDLPRLDALDDIRHRAEDRMTDNDDQRPTFVYTTYIRASAEKVWHALTDADLTAAYWGHANVSDWQPGSRWEHTRTDGSGTVDVAGTVVASEPSRRLVITFGPPEFDDGDRTVVTFNLEPWHDIVRLTLTHERFPSGDDRELAASGWPAVLANLKTLLETGDVLPQAPWEMDTAAR